MSCPITTEWVFFRDLSGRWRWEARGDGEAIRESTRNFTSRQECVADAYRFGFGAAATSPEPAPAAAPSART